MNRTILIICLLFMGCKIQGHFESKPIEKGAKEIPEKLEFEPYIEEDEIFSNSGTLTVEGTKIIHCDSLNKNLPLVLEDSYRYNITTKPNGDMVFECKE